MKFIYYWRPLHFGSEGVRIRTDSVLDPRPKEQPLHYTTTPNTQMLGPRHTSVKKGMAPPIPPPIYS